MTPADTPKALAQETLDALAAVQDRPEAMQPFDDSFRSTDRLRELKESGKKLVGSLCNFAPDELILAAGAIPLRLDNGYPPATGEARPMPVDVCCAVRTLVRNPGDDPAGLPAVDLTVVPTACDGKKKLAGILARDREVFTLELPVSKRSEHGQESWRSQIRGLVRRLQDLTGQTITRRSMREAVALVNRRTAVFRELNDLRSTERPPINGLDAFLVMHTSFLADPAWWVEKTERLVEELRQRVESGLGKRPRTRLLVTGSPVLFPDYKLPRAVWAAGADVVADEMCSGTQRLYHPIVEDESTRGGLIRAAGERALLPSTCPCFAETDDRLARIGEQIASHGVDGVIHHTLRVCQNYDIDAVTLGGWLADRGVPFLSLHAEFGSEGAEGFQNRIEAFVEMITQGPKDDGAPDA